MSTDELDDRALLAQLAAKLAEPAKPVGPPRLTPLALAVGLEFRETDRKKAVRRHVENMASRGPSEAAPFWRRLALAAKRAFVVA